MTATEIRDLRLSLHLSQSKFAKLLKVNRITVWLWENDKTKPYDYNIQLLKDLRKDK